MARILLDVDGVVAQFVEPLYDLMAPVYPGLPHPSTYTEWDFIKAHLSDEQRKTLLRHLQGQEFWSTQPLIPGALEAVEAFRQADVEVHFVTSPWQSCPVWENCRRRWLLRHFGQFGITADHIHMAGMKHIYCGNVFVDDKFANVQEWSNEQIVGNPSGHSRRSFLFDAPYNRTVKWRHRLAGWTAESVQLVLAAAAR